jgi:hypothetical protein
MVKLDEQLYRWKEGLPESRWGQKVDARLEQNLYQSLRDSTHPPRWQQFPCHPNHHHAAFRCQEQDHEAEQLLSEH